MRVLSDHFCGTYLAFTGNWWGLVSNVDAHEGDASTFAAPGLAQSVQRAEYWGMFWSSRHFIELFLELTTVMLSKQPLG